MRVLHIGLYDRVGGGCIAAYRQHQALRQAGVDSRMWVRFKVTNDPTVTAFQPSLRFRPRLTRLIQRYLYQYQWRRAGLKGEMFDARSEHGADMLAGMPEADVINVQFGWEFLDYPGFFRVLPSHIPVVVTMHEMGTFTGGCSYAESCQGFLKNCGNCPKLSRNSTKDLSRVGWNLRHKSFLTKGKGSLHFVAVSQWLANQAKASSLLNKQENSVIHNGLNTSIYRPLNKNSSRESLGIPSARKVVAFAAASVDDPRKGIRQLVESVMGMQEKPFLLTWGKKYPTNLQSLPHLHLGNIESEHFMAIAYNAADVFVMPSLEEAFGQTALEASACGVPVAAFAAGGIPEIVRHNETGLLVPVGDARALKEALEKMLNDKSLRENLGRRGVEVAREEFSFQKNADSYVKLYQSMLERVR